MRTCASTRPHSTMTFGSEWTSRSADDLAAALDAAGVEAVVDLDGGWGDRLRDELARRGSRLPVCYQFTFAANCMARAAFA